MSLNRSRVVLALKSQYFAEALEGQHELVLPFPDPHNLFPDILGFMYRNTITVKGEHIVALIALAGQLKLTTLNVCCILDADSFILIFFRIFSARSCQ